MIQRRHLAIVAVLCAILYLSPPLANAFPGGEAASVELGQSIFNTQATGDGATQMSDPYTAVFDSHGDLWVADRSNNRVLEFAAPFTSGEAATIELGQSSGFGNNSPGTSAVDMSGPAALAFDSSGNLWVADRGNNRVLEFNSPFSTPGACRNPTS